MNPFHRINTVWLPRISIAMLIYTILFQVINGAAVPILAAASPVLFYVITFYGLKTVLKDDSVSIQDFFIRPANIATLCRSVLVLTGIICGFFWLEHEIHVLKICSLLMIVLGYTADLLDGWLARHEKKKPPSAKWGGWYDAETDGLLLLLTCLFITEFETVPDYFLLPGLFRFVFGLIYWFFPADFHSPRWYHWYSKTVAAIFESVIALLWCTLLVAGESAALNEFLNVQIKIFYPVNIILISSSFIIESLFRFRVILDSIPRGYRIGILRSFLIYYRIPFRKNRMKNFYSRFLGPDDLAFDVGAHLGNRTSIFLELGAQVVSFEPQPACRDLLELWFGENNKIHLEYIALGAAEKEVNMMLSRRYPALASTDSEWVELLKTQKEFSGIDWSETYTAEIKTLDNMIEKYGKPRFIKIDTEGSEGEVLAGLNFASEFISCEFLPSRKKRALRCIQRMTEIGDYKYNYSVGESMKFSLASEVSAEELISIIESYPSGGKSGDIYAFRQNSD